MFFTVLTIQKFYVTIEIFNRKSFVYTIKIRYNIILKIYEELEGTAVARAKEKSVFFCQECGYESAKWLGKCPGCGQWNTFVEETVSKQKSETARLLPSSEPVLLHEIVYDDMLRMDTGIQELNRVLGGGIVSGSAVLLSGEPGIGKSTLLMQISGKLCPKNKVLYVSGEESGSQIKLRAKRLGVSPDNLYILIETNIDKILAQVESIKPDIVIVDSIQTVWYNYFER